VRIAWRPLTVPLDPSDSRFRPLLSAAAVPEDEAVLVVLSDREVRIGGSPHQAGRILALLDGTRTVAEVADSAELPAEEVQDLLGSLAEQGAVVDCVDAWRRFQRESSIDSGLFRALDDESLERVRLSRFEPPSGDRVLLSPQPTSVRQIVELRESAPAGGEARPVSFGELSGVLDAMYGRVRSGNRTVPSAGAFYALVVHLLVSREVGPLRPGTWLYDGAGGELALVGDRPVAAPDVFVSYAAHDSLLFSGNPVVMVSADVDRPASKYSNRAYRFALMEAGAAMQMAYVAGTELGLPVRAIGGVDEQAATELLGLPESIAPLLGITLGA